MPTLRDFPIDYNDYDFSEPPLTPDQQHNRALVQRRFDDECRAEQMEATLRFFSRLCMATAILGVTVLVTYHLFIKVL